MVTHGATGWRRFGGDERGQGIVFGAIMLFLFVLFGVLVYNVGQVVTRRVSVQEAADAAARSGALAQANVISSVAWMNDGMAYLYYCAMRHAVDVTKFGVLAELKGHGPPFPSDGVIGIDNPIGRYNTAYTQASEWIPRLERWLDRLARMERTIALSADVLVKREIAREVIANLEPEGGIYACTFFPDFTFFPKPGSHVILRIERLHSPDGWRITSNTGYKVEIINLGPGHWRLTASDGTTLELRRLGNNKWQLINGDQITTITRSGPNGDIIDIELNDADHTRIHAEKAGSLGWVVVATSDKMTVKYEPFAQGGFLITVSEGGSTYSVSVRRRSDGRLEQWTGSRWKLVPGQDTHVDVGGQQVPVQFSNTINLPGGATLNLPSTITLGPMRFTMPNTVTIGGTTITLGQTDVRVTARVGPVTFIIHEDTSINVNGLTVEDADGRWRPRGGGDYRGTARHRLYEEAPDVYIYEYVTTASFFLDENLARFGHHAIFDNDPAAKSSGNDPAFVSWFDTSRGAARSDQAYHQTRVCWYDYSGDDPMHGEDCPICAGRDHDGDGQSDVRKYQSDATRDSPPYQSVNLDGFARPLRLTEDFFYYGMNVAVWREKDEPMFSGDLAHLGQVLPLFRNPDWGYYAVASAKAGFLEPAGGGSSGQQFRFRFPTPADTNDWVDRAYANLYEPIWTAKLVSTREAIRSIDIDAIQPDSGTSWLWRGFSKTVWFDPKPASEIGEHRSGQNVTGRIRNMTNREGRSFLFFEAEHPDRLSEVIEH